MSVGLVALLAACSANKADTPTLSPVPSGSPAQTIASPVATATPTVSPDASATTEVTPAASAVTPATASPAASGQKPGELPADYPLPADAIITNSHSESNDGKKSVLLTYTTKENMADISALYKDYFQKRKLKDAAITSDERNLIIQGATEDGKEQWSLIGTSLASQEGVIDLTLTWAEQ
jgi:hypothetical protein